MFSLLPGTGMTGLFPGTRPRPTSNAADALDFSAPELLVGVLSERVSLSPQRIREALVANGVGADSAARNSLRQILGESLYQECRSLAQEADREMLFEGLRNLGQRLVTEDRLELAAMFLYAAQSAASTDVQRAVARRELEALLGRGSFGSRSELLLRRFAREATDPSALLAMGVAGTVFRMTRLSVLSRLVASPGAGWLSRGWGARLAAGGIGFLAEAPAFTLAHRAGNALLGREQDWSATSLRRDFLGSALFLGSLKVFGGMGSIAVGRWGQGPGLAASLARGMLPQTAMFSGILLGHRMETALGWRPASGGAEQIGDALATLLQFHVGGRLAQHAFGESFGHWERAMDLRAEALAREPRMVSPPGSWAPHPIFSPCPAFAAAGPHDSKSEPLGPNFMMSTSEGEGRGGSGPRGPTSAEVNYHLALVESEEPLVGLTSVARLQDILLGNGRMRPKRYVDLFERLYRKTDVNITGEVYESIIEGLNSVLERVNVRSPGPWALFREMMKPERAEDLIVPGFYAAWLKNPSLARAEREQIVARTLQILRDPGVKNEVPHDQALTLIQEALDYPHLEEEFIPDLVTEVVQFAQRNSNWFNAFEPSLELSRRIFQEGRASGLAQAQLLEVLSRGVADNNLRSQRRADLLAFLEDLSEEPLISDPFRAMLEEHLMQVREKFVEDNLQELRNHPTDFTNHPEIGYLLTREYLEDEMRVGLAGELFEDFLHQRPEALIYNHTVSVAMDNVLHPNLRAEMSRRTCSAGPTVFWPACPRISECLSPSIGSRN
ncbi:MAG: hypothetical protein K8R69_00660 [Deltaproteobacteria bacterium]|nr:hypothetical protein [Deltaproteobacteria bacterium]